jgi:hypothetical protein
MGSCFSCDTRLSLQCPSLAACPRRSLKRGDLRETPLALAVQNCRIFMTNGQDDLAELTAVLVELLPFASKPIAVKSVASLGMPWRIVTPRFLRRIRRISRFARAPRGV